MNCDIHDTLNLGLNPIAQSFFVLCLFFFMLGLYFTDLCSSVHGSSFVHGHKGSLVLNSLWSDQVMLITLLVIRGSMAHHLRVKNAFIQIMPYRFVINHCSYLDGVKTRAEDSGWDFSAIKEINLQ